jgi:hypothetical protein
MLVLPKNQINPFGVRMPHELKEWLKQNSVMNRRSLNAEIVVRLEESRKNEIAQSGSARSK